MTSTQPLRINAHISIPRSELRFSFVRSSGPGGQNVNKVASKAVLRWTVAERVYRSRTTCVFDFLTANRTADQ